MTEAIIELPKIDLHCHLDGSLTRGCIEELLGRRVDIEELQVDADCRSLAEYLEKFQLPLACLQTEEGLRRAGYDFMQNVVKDRISYLEVRFAPRLSVNENLDCGKVIEAVLEGLERGAREYHIDYGVIVCAMRHHGEEENMQMMRTAREYLGQGVCGADLAGDEASYPMKNYSNLFGEVKKLGLPFTIHAGECGSVENVMEAVECGARRIGHGIALRGHYQDINICKERGIGIEMCPISNLQTKAVKSKAEYPMSEFLDQGLMVTINTDNRTVSDTTIGKEIAFVQESYGITDEEIRMMMKNAAKIAFASDEVKDRLLRMY